MGSVNDTVFNAYLDESLVTRYHQNVVIGKRLMVGAVVTLDDQLEGAMDSRAADVLADEARWVYRQDRDRGRDRQLLFLKEGFHFCQDSDSIRGEGLEVMFEGDFRAHVIYSHLGLPGLTEVQLQVAMYSTLIRTLLLRY